MGHQGKKMSALSGILDGVGQLKKRHMLLSAYGYDKTLGRLALWRGSTLSDRGWRFQFIAS